MTEPRFPAIDPSATGMLDVGAGQRIYWETCGNRDGIPMLFLHGGPGAGCTPGQRRLFDPEVFRIVLFDQRGAGRSRPPVSDPGTDLGANTTAHLVADIEALRDHLGVEAWGVLGLSWGTTLGLAYAQAHRRRVRFLVLALVTTTSRREVRWITEDMGRIFPDEWDRFASAVPARMRHLPLVDAYAELLADPDPAVRERAAREWCAWEETHISLTPGHRPNPRFDDPRFRFGFARLVTHYWRNHAFVEDGRLLSDAPRLAGIPGVLIHGRYDVSSPLETARRLCSRWPGSRLHVVDDAGHGGGALLGAIDGALAEMAAAPR